MKKQVVLSACMLLAANPLSARSRMGDIFDDMHQEMLRMHEEMSKAFDQAYQSSAMIASGRNAGPALSLKHADGKVEIIVNNFEKPDSIEAEFDHKKNTVKVSTPQAVIGIFARDTALSVAIEVRAQHKAEKKSADDTSDAVAQYAAYSSSQFSQRTERPVDIEKADIEYDEAGKRLVISLPMEVAKTTKIPVRMTTQDK